MGPKLEPFEVIDLAETPIGLLYLRRRELPDESKTIVTEVMIDGALLMSSENTVSERALATSALALHGGKGLRVLVGGLGLGYTAHAALQSGQVAELEVVDRLTKVGGWLYAGHLPLSDALARDRRLRLVEADVYGSLLGPAPPVAWDLLLIDVDHAPRNRLDESSAPFYTVEGQQRVKRHLGPGGVLAVWSAEDDDPFAAVLDQVYPHAEREQVSWVCPELTGEHTLFLARRE